LIRNKPLGQPIRACPIPEGMLLVLGRPGDEKDPSVNRFALARSPEGMLFVLGRPGDKKRPLRGGPWPASCAPACISGEAAGAAGPCRASRVTLLRIVGRVYQGPDGGRGFQAARSCLSTKGRIPPCR